MKLARCLVGALLGAAFAIPSHAAQRTFVATNGSDANACSLAAPCRSFSGALARTDANGEIVVLDSGGYGGLTIGQSVTISSPAGVYAGISVFGGTDGIVVAPGASKVVLRGLTINGQGGNFGIRVQSGDVHVENCVIANLTVSGILVEGGTSVRLSGVVSRTNAFGLDVYPVASPVSVVVRDSEFANNATAGISVWSATPAASASVTLENTSVVKNSVGVMTTSMGTGLATLVVARSVVSDNAGGGIAINGAGATAFVRDSTVSRNNVGLVQSNSAVLNACGSILLVGNGTAKTGTINVDAAACLDQVAGGGSVTSVGVGAGLTASPNPITTSGILGLASTQLLPTVACAANQIPKWVAGAWTCAADANSGGTVTQVNSGTGLTGGPITGTGTIGVLAGGISATELATAAVTSAKIASGNVTFDKLASAGCSAGQVLKWSGTAWACATDDTAGTNAFVQSGNSFGATAVLGTKDGYPLHLIVANNPALRILPVSESPIVVAGHANNAYFPGAAGQTVSGGGRAGTNCYDPPSDGSTRSCANVATGTYATIGGGQSNEAASRATVGGGVGNTASGIEATIGGGIYNIAGAESTVAGGTGNQAYSQSAVGGGAQNEASGQYSTVGGGQGNKATFQWTVVAGGELNTAQGMHAAIGGGESNVASGPHSFVAGGSQNEATGAWTFAGGHKAMTHTPGPSPTDHAGAFVWAGYAPGAQPFYSVADYEFAVRAVGGVRLVTNVNIATGDPLAGVTLAAGSSTWASISDRAAKRDLLAVDARDVLSKVVAMPVYTWRYRAEASAALHMGPTAQDFRAAFGLGDSDRTITTIDEGGVALAAIQGLNDKLVEASRAQRARIAELERQVAELADRVRDAEALGAEVALIKAAMSGMRRVPASVAAR